LKKNTATFVKRNVNWPTITGYTETELEGMRALDFFAEGENRGLCQQRMQEVYDKGSSTMENLLLTKSGEEIPYYFTGERLVIAGKVYLVGLGIDITERARAEQALRESEEKFRTMFESMVEGVAMHELIYDANGEPIDYRIIDVNAAYEKHTGLRPETVVGKTSRMAYGMSEPPYWDIFRRVALEQKPHVFEACHEPMHRHFVVSVVSPKKGSFVTIFEDITQRKQAEEQVRHGQKMDAVGQLAGGIAHDFNNMLAGIMGSADLLAGKLINDEDLMRNVQLILDASTRASDLTQKLLAFSHKATFKAEAFHLHAVIHETIDILKRSIDKRIGIYVNVCAPHDIVIGDATQIQNAIMNIALNARDAMPEGGELHFHTQEKYFDAAYCELSPFDLNEGAYVELTIADTGTGMMSDIKEKIFEPFFTTKEMRKGTGLGLSTVYTTIKEHSGAIHVESEVHKGTIFTLHVPIDAEATVKGEQQEQETLRALSGHVLLVDDEEIVLSTTKELLQDVGLTVSCVQNGNDAIALFSEHHATIDLVVLDLIMPDKSGKETFDALQLISRDVPIVITSGYSFDTNTKDILKKGALGFLKKPYTQMDIVTMIKGVLQ